MPFNNKPAIDLFASGLASPPLRIRADLGDRHVDAELYADGSVGCNDNRYTNIQKAMNATQFNPDITCTPWQFWSWLSTERRAWTPLEHLRAALSTSRDHSEDLTSDSHPLRIDHVEFPDSNSKIGLTFCPGKKCEGIYSGTWARDLDKDLKVINAWGSQTLVSLMEAHEFEELGVPEFFETMSKSSVRWYHLPIPDLQTPTRQFEELWSGIGPILHEQLANGQSIVIHCRGGLGRTGVLAARILVEAGANPIEAVATVRAGREHSIETYAQENYVLTKRWLS